MNASSDTISFDEQVIALIAQSVPGRFRNVAISRETRLRELGIDSLGLAATVFRLEKAFGISLACLDLNDYLVQLRTVGDALDVSRRIVEDARAASMC